MIFIIINKTKSTKRSKIKNNLSVAKTEEKHASVSIYALIFSLLR